MSCLNLEQYLAIIRQISSNMSQRLLLWDWMLRFDVRILTVCSPKFSESSSVFNDIQMISFEASYLIIFDFVIAFPPLHCKYVVWAWQLACEISFLFLAFGITISASLLPSALQIQRSQASECLKSCKICAHNLQDLHWGWQCLCISKQCNSRNGFQFSPSIQGWLITFLGRLAFLWLFE